jgi:hypothetical protein
MSTAITGNEYSIDVVINETLYHLQFPVGSGATDDFIVALIEAINGVAVPTGLTFNAYGATKTVVSDTVYTANTTATPPTFS